VSILVLLLLMMQTKAAPQFESECICRREESETTGLEAYCSVGWWLMAGAGLF
jgi:hypothetical protein